MTLEIKVLNLGLLKTNAYIIADIETKNAVLIDPVDQAPLLIESAENEGWAIKLILATHAHFDHVLASAELKEKTGAPFYIHEDCVKWLANLPATGVRFTGSPYPEAAEPDRLLKSESDTIELDGIKLETLYTPGHAEGHLSYYMPDYKVVFSGDALFAGSIGRTDLPGADYHKLMNSIFDKLMTLDDDVNVLPGHGGATTIGRERRTNQYLLSYERNSQS